MAVILNIPNSFVTFYDPENDIGRSQYITDTECGIQKDFCYPIYDEKDLLFQTSIMSDLILNNSNVIIGKNGTDLTGVAVQVTQVGLYMGAIPIYNIYCSFFSSNLTSGLQDGDCFNLEIRLDGFEIRTPTFISNQCFKKVNDKCLTTKLFYRNTSNAFGFRYDLLGGQPNAIRLPLYFKEPNISSDKTVYVRPDGSRQLLSARLAKRYKGMIDEVPEETHQNLVIALNHDFVRFVPENYVNINGFAARFEDEYNNNYPEIMQNVNIWSADFTIFETPFNNFNSNCG